MTQTPVSVLARLGAAGQIIGAIAALFATALILGGAVTPFLPDFLRTPVLALAMWGAVLAGWAMLRLSKTSYRDIGLALPKNWLACLGWAAVAVIVSFAGALLLGEVIRRTTDWPPLDVTYIRSAIEGNLPAYIAWMILVVWGSAAFGEELLARGFIMDRLQVVFGRGRLGIVLAVVLQAAIFGALHAVQGMTGVVITAFVGIVFAWVYFAAGRNLWPVILAHGAVDSLSLTLMYLDIDLAGYIR